MKIEPLIAAAAAELTAIRRDIHAHPELGFEEERTSTIVAQKLKEWGCEVTTGIGKTGVVGTIRVGNNPRAIGLRAVDKTRSDLSSSTVRFSAQMSCFSPLASTKLTKVMRCWPSCVSANSTTSRQSWKPKKSGTMLGCPAFKS